MTLFLDERTDSDALWHGPAPGFAEMKKKLEAIMAGHAGRTPEELAEACDRDNFMSPIEAKEFGLIDHVLTPEEQADLK
mgnify:CR=1 FL=1